MQCISFDYHAFICHLLHHIDDSSNTAMCKRREDTRTIGSSLDHSRVDERRQRLPLLESLHPPPGTVSQGAITPPAYTHHQSDLGAK